MTNDEIFLLEREGPTLIITPTVNLSELEYEASATEDIYDLFEDEMLKNVIMDFHRTEYFGSTALGFFVRLWKRVQQREGRMAFCNITTHEADILRITKLDQYWGLCSTREEAVEFVNG